MFKKIAFVLLFSLSLTGGYAFNLLRSKPAAAIDNVPQLSCGCNGSCNCGCQQTGTCGCRK